MASSGQAEASDIRVRDVAVSEDELSVVMGPCAATHVPRGRLRAVSHLRRLGSAFHRYPWRSYTTLRDAPSGGAPFALSIVVRRGCDEVLMWQRSDDTRCIASRRAVASRWEVRVVRRSSILRRVVFRCFMRAFRAADAWRIEFGGSRA